MSGKSVLNGHHTVPVNTTFFFFFKRYNSISLYNIIDVATFANANKIAPSKFTQSQQYNLSAH